MTQAAAAEVPARTDVLGRRLRLASPVTALTIGGLVLVLAVLDGYFCQSSQGGAVEVKSACGFDAYRCAVGVACHRISTETYR